MTDVYNIRAAGFTQLMDPALPGPTTIWGFSDTIGDTNQRYLGGVILATKGTPVLLNIKNELEPGRSVVPVDPTLMAGDGQTVGQLPANRIAIHLHGGRTPWFSDGTPFQWYTASGAIGSSFQVPNGLPNNLSPVTDPAANPDQGPQNGIASYYYPVAESARMMWYHDHAIGITRTNVYSGLVSAFMVTDDFEKLLVTDGLLDDAVGIPLVIQDKGFVPSDIGSQDPTWEAAAAGLAGGGGPGSLWYPHVYDPLQMGGTGPIGSAGNDCSPNPIGRWDYGPCQLIGNGVPDAVLPPGNETLPTPASVVGEAFQDTILVNGGLYPTLHVPPRRVRLRILNGANARFFHLNVWPEAGTTGEPTPGPNNAPVDPALPNGPGFAGAQGPIMYQIGNEGGFFPQVVTHNNNTPIPLDLTDDDTGQTVFPDGPFNLLLSPAERADVVIDFNGQSGNFILYNDAPAPFPGGDPLNDYFTGGPIGFTGNNTAQGSGPNTRTLMRITVDSSLGSGDSTPTQQWLTTMNTMLADNFASGGGIGTGAGNNGVPPQQAPLLGTFGTPTISGVPTRSLTLNEDFDEFGRLIQRLGTLTTGPNNQGLDTFGVPYDNVPGSDQSVTPGRAPGQDSSGTTEIVAAGATEVWEIFNTTADTHPMHFHLVNVQVLARQTFTGDANTLPLTLTGSVRAPDANEMGWKETVRMNPGEVTWIAMKFDLPALPAAMAANNPASPRIGGHEYVWHCHILEHEEHDMMRPVRVRGQFNIMPTSTPTATSQ